VLVWPAASGSYNNGGLHFVTHSPASFEMPCFINGIIIFNGVDEPAVSVSFVLKLPNAMAETLLRLNDTL
jgi:hypothetical protein